MVYMIALVLEKMSMMVIVLIVLLVTINITYILRKKITDID